MAEDVTAGKGRKEKPEPYPEGDAEFITPGEINLDTNRDGPGVQQNDELKGAERLRRLGHDEDKAYGEALGD